jgi:hypothetical protein
MKKRENATGGDKKSTGACYGFAGTSDATAIAGPVALRRVLSKFRFPCKENRQKFDRGDAGSLAVTHDRVGLDFDQRSGRSARTSTIVVAGGSRRRRCRGRRRRPPTG